MRERDGAAAVEGGSGEAEFVSSRGSIRFGVELYLCIRNHDLAQRIGGGSRFAGVGVAVEAEALGRRLTCVMVPFLWHRLDQTLN